MWGVRERWEQVAKGRRLLLKNWEVGGGLRRRSLAYVFREGSLHQLPGIPWLSAPAETPSLHLSQTPSLRSPALEHFGTRLLAGKTKRSENWQMEFSHPMSRKQSGVKPSPPGRRDRASSGVTHVFPAAKHNEFISVLLKPRRKQILKSFYQMRNNKQEVLP